MAGETTRSCTSPYGVLVRRRRFLGIAGIALSCHLFGSRDLGMQSVTYAEDITLKNGIVLHGSVTAIAELPTKTIKLPAAGGVGVANKPLAVVDDGLRRVVVSKRLSPNGPVPTPEVIERITIPQRVAESGNTVQVIGSVLEVGPFDKHGRRVFSMAGGPRGRADVMQGITEINPVYTKVEGLVASTSYVWDMRVATSSLPGDTLRKVLHSRIDPKNAEARLKIIRLLIKAQRIPEAEAEIALAIKDFPELAAMQTQRQALRQFGAERGIEEIKFRRDAGQHRLAWQMIEGFPDADVAKIKLVEIRDIKEELAKRAEEGEAIRAKLKEILAECEDEALRARLQPYIQEIRRELNFNTVDRMQTFTRRQDDETLKPEQKIALAISGWLLGSADESFINSSVARSLGETRDLIRQYFRTTTPGERAQILDEIASQEAGTPQYVAQLLKHMRPVADVFEEAPAERKQRNLFDERPPKEKDAEATDARRRDDPKKKTDKKIVDEEATPQAPADGDKQEEPANTVAESKESETEAPAKAEELDEDRAKPVENPAGSDPDMPGLFRLQATPIIGQPAIPFLVQLPPEYDPLRKYPCIVTMAKPGVSPEQQITWWAGEYDQAIQSRRGQATRHGYIVIAPLWYEEHQYEYHYSAKEHGAALGALREAMKRFSINSDRVFISGHGVGGDAAWDIALAHPDLWAGLICICGKSGKYVERYHENARMLPMYFVEGSLEGDKRLVNNSQFNRYMLSASIPYNVMLVEYIGRGPDHFYDEVLHIFEWMKLHGRNFFPDSFGKVSENGTDVMSMRKWDSFFWWLEITEPPPKAMVAPVAWPPDPKEFKALQISGELLKETNSVRVKPGLTKGKVWLAPEMVDFQKKGNVEFSGSKRKIPIPKPEVGVILEDVRLRGDRDHPFWASVDYSFVKEK
jgi:hypothetical protein